MWRWTSWGEPELCFLVQRQRIPSAVWQLLSVFILCSPVLPFRPQPAQWPSNFVFLVQDLDELFLISFVLSIGRSYTASSLYFLLLQPSASWVPLAMVEFRWGQWWHILSTYSALWADIASVTVYFPENMDTTSKILWHSSQPETVDRNWSYLSDNKSYLWTDSCLSTLGSFTIGQKQYSSYLGSIIHK